MKDQVLDGAGGAVLRSPGFEFVVMVEEQFRQVTGIFAVVLGATGDEGFAIPLEGDGLDGIEGDPWISYQEGNEVGGGLLQTQSDAAMGRGFVKVGARFPEGRRGGGVGIRAALADGGGDQVEVGRGIGTI